MSDASRTSTLAKATGTFSSTENQLSDIPNQWIVDDLEKNSAYIFKETEKDMSLQNSGNTK